MMKRMGYELGLEGQLDMCRSVLSEEKSFSKLTNL